MSSKTRFLQVAAIAALLAAACGPPGNSDDTIGDDDAPNPCGDGCPVDQVCVPEVGCRACNPGQFYCDGPDDDQIFKCNADGTGGDFSMECPDSQACLDGQCLGACDAAEADPSNVGCHFYAVDLDNEAADVFGVFTNDAAAQQFAIAVANVNDYPVQVEVYKNVAAFGAPISEELVTSVQIPANDLRQIDLPQREVDGTMGQNGAYVMDSGSGTFVSSHAFRVQSSAPVVAYQFQPVIQQYSNDASILIPRQALGKNYLVLGWPTSNPCGAPMGDPLYMQSIPDHTFVTIVGVHENTHIVVTPSHPVLASGGPSGAAIAATPAGGTIELDIGPYDVVNLESDQFIGSLLDCIGMAADRDGDFTGTHIRSTKPVVVFSGNERGSGTGGAMPPDPPGWDGESCCTDHLEEQLFPVEAWGWTFAVSRSPVRSTMGGYEEPDLYRVIASVDNTVVVTSLPAPDDSFVLNAGEFRSFHAYGGFTVESMGGAINVGQYLVSQGLVPGGIGDPTFTIFPAADQHRDHYVFLVPTTFEKNYMVLAMPVSAGVVLDGQTEFPPACETRMIGSLGGVEYKQVTCELEEGVHRVTTSEPAGLTVYGYYNVGSYGYPGGSDVDIINPID